MPTPRGSGATASSGRPPPSRSPAPMPGPIGGRSSAMRWRSSGCGGEPCAGAYRRWPSSISRRNTGPGRVPIGPSARTATSGSRSRGAPSRSRSPSSSSSGRRGCTSTSSRPRTVPSSSPCWPSSGCGSPAPDRPARDRQAARAGGPAGRLVMTSAGRHPQLLRAGVPHQAGRAAGPLHDAVVRRRRRPANTTCSAPSICGTEHSR